MPIDNKCSCKGYNLDKLLQPSILAILTSQPMHGYMIIQELENRNLHQGDKQPDHAGVYRTLKIMEERGLVKYEWQMDNTGAPKKIYRLSDQGLECLGNWLDTLEDYKKSIECIIGEVKISLTAHS